MLLYNKKFKDIKEPEKQIILGKIGSAYGVHGWVRIISSTEKSENIFNYQPWFIKKFTIWKQIKFNQQRKINKKYIIKINGIEDRKSVAELTNSEIIIDSSQLPILKEKEYYWKDIIGCEVSTINGHFFGRVTELFKNIYNDIMIVSSFSKDIFGIKTRYIPFIFGQIIKDINLTTRTIKIVWDPKF